ncbi:unnamed protein product [Paramecium sonneborni]|uniref:Uncharacterized protein n=1 Tax=Paramecium sonneborni TaxID=65129 RepID=A0A8S1N4Z5_9CILI|nr:unnamed protein product [Paramecium sonneborni]
MGVCDFFFLNEKGQKEFVTPILDGLILPRIIRDSIYFISRKQLEQWVNLKQLKKKLYIQEIIESIESRRQNFQLFLYFGLQIFNQVSNARWSKQKPICCCTQKTSNQYINVFQLRIYKVSISNKTVYLSILLNIS